MTACSTGAHAIGDAARLIALGDADVMVAGGTESPLCRISIAGFAACKALCTTFNDQPTKGSRPYDKDRDGFVMGEGSGIVVLESLEHAKKRGARIYAEVIGYGLSGDAYHITAPSEDGDGAYRSMRMALKRANIQASDIQYVNAHGTSTMGDEIELGAVERLFGNAAGTLSMSSTKSAIGHLLGAAGSVEAIYSVLAITHNVAPPTLISTIRPSRRQSTSCRIRRASVRSMSRCRTPSASAAPTPRCCCAATSTDAGREGDCGHPQDRLRLRRAPSNAL